MANLVQEQELFFNKFEPMVKNRFIMYVDGIPSFIIKGVTRPTMTQQAQPIDHINLQRYTKGKSIWGQMTMTLYEPIVPSGAQSVMEWVRLHHESVTGRDGYAEFYKKDIVLNGLGPVGDKVQEWILKGCQIVSFTMGDFNWSDGGAVTEIQLVIQPDYCVLNY